MATFSDNFDRANEDPIASPWAQGSGDPAAFIIATNVATVASFSANDACSLVTSPSFSADHGASANIACQVSIVGTGMGLALRHAAAARTCYRIIIFATATNNLEIAKFSPTYGALQTSSITFASGDKFTAEVSGPASNAVIVIKVNDVQAATYTDTSNTVTASGMPGMQYSGNAVSGSINNFQAYDLVSDITNAPEKLIVNHSNYLR